MSTTYFGQTEYSFTQYGQPSPSSSKKPSSSSRLHAKDPEPLPEAPDSSFVDSTVASSAMKRFLSAKVSEEGFEHAEPEALLRFEREVIAFVEQVFGRSKGFAEIASRTLPNAEDVLMACEEYDLRVKELRRESRKRKRDNIAPTEFVVPSRRSQSPTLLESDDEDAEPALPSTLASLPRQPFLPPLPPKHTYLRTPAPPMKKQAITSLEKKLENASLVQQSLKNLLLSTEDSADQNDGELFGGVINWESTRHPRKKWKLGS